MRVVLRHLQGGFSTGCSLCIWQQCTCAAVLTVSTCLSWQFLEMDVSYRRVASMPKTEVWLLRYGPRMYAVCCKESSWLGKEAFSTIQAGATGFLLQFNQQKQRCIAILKMMEII